MTTTTMVDARWLGFSGVGRVTEQFLLGLADLRPPGRWVIWGGERAAALAGEAGAEFVRAVTSPLARLGQAQFASVPAADRYLFLHTVRPLRGGRRAVVLLHDTIPVRFASPRWKRPLQRAFYTVSTRAAGGVLVYSDATAERAVSDLGLNGGSIHRIDLTTDLRIAAEARSSREGSGAHLLYVGLDRPQKNLDRALAGYAISAFGRDGRPFVLVGVQPEALASLRRRAEGIAGDNVVVRQRCTDAELIELYAHAAAVIVPSLEEGYGLPVIEALAAGVPVCCSNRSGTAEAAHGLAELFDPLDPRSIGSAIDRAVDHGRSGAWDAQAARFAAEVRLPTPREFTAQIVDVLDRVNRVG